LAESGDPARFATPRALVKHAGLCPRENASGAAQGKTSISGRGRPGLWLAAWRAVWAAMPNNPVMAARFVHLTTRQGQPAGPPASPDRLRSRPAALDPRRGHPPRRLGPRHRRRHQPGTPGRVNPATSS
jgi:Transposase IS116/IS110/IS902 family